MTRTAPCVMVVGTSSDVGKSVITTALCRVLTEEGFRVAPFKAMNMSLNAAVTPDGLEIGRAQAVQADAAGIPPRVEMNPLLLKPESGGRSQLIVLGRPAGSYEPTVYWGSPADRWAVVTTSLRTLRREFDVVVIEGAGGAAELNLRRSDVANMRLAVHAHASVILVGDIERGGIFAQLLGTLDLLRPAERRLIRGLLVNKFRGDRGLFASGVEILERRCGLPVLGVMPYSNELGVAAEDEVSLDRFDSGASDGPDIAVIRYPHISNFDDLEPLDAAGAQVRYVTSADALRVPDLVVLPGSKTTIDDLEWLRTCGIGARLRALADAGVPVLGICGGYQMLGLTLADPKGVEGTPATVRGLGLLEVETVFERAKLAVPVAGHQIGESFLGAEGRVLRGYELHLGETRRAGARPFAEIHREPSGEHALDGAVSADGRVVGTYVHGLFADARVREALFASLHAKHRPRPEPEDRFAHLSHWLRSNADVLTIAGWVKAASDVAGRI